MRGAGSMKLGVTAVMLPELDFDEQIALCRSLGVTYYQYRPRTIPESAKGGEYGPWGNHKFDLTPERLLAEGAILTQRLRSAGMEPWGTLPTVTIDADDAVLRMHFEGAAIADAGRVNCAPPPYPQEPFDFVGFLQRTIDRYADVVYRLARSCGIKVVVETHSRGLLSSPGQAWALCRHFAPTELGVIFDLNNFGVEGEVEPNLAVSMLAAYIDCVHLGGRRRVAAEVDRHGCKVIHHECCALEEADLHIPTWLLALRKAGLEPPIIIEDFAPCLTSAERLGRCVRFVRRILDEEALPA